MLRETPFDLHVLSTPPAFVLSQDQTLNKNDPMFSTPVKFLSKLNLSCNYSISLALPRSRGSRLKGPFLVLSFVTLFNLQGARRLVATGSYLTTPFQVCQQLFFIPAKFFSPLPLFSRCPVRRSINISDPSPFVNTFFPLFSPPFAKKSTPCLFPPFL